MSSSSESFSFSDHSDQKLGFTSVHSAKKAKMGNVKKNDSLTIESRLLHLVQFIQKALDKGWSDKQVKVSLLSYGWPEDLINKSYAVAVGLHHNGNSSSKKLSDEIEHLSEETLQLSKKNSLLHDLLFSDVESYGKKIRSHYSTHFYSKSRNKLSLDELKHLKENAEHLSDDKQEVLQNQQYMQQPQPNAGGGQPISINITDGQSIRGARGVSGNGGTNGESQATQDDESQSPSVVQPVIEVSRQQLESVKDVAAKSSQYTRPSAGGSGGGGASNSNASGGSGDVHHHHHYGTGQMGLYNPVVEEKIVFAETPIGERAQTGIPDLDGVISGGLKRNSSVVVSGGAGTGKTTFALQYLVNGIIMFNEPGVFVTFEQTRVSIIELGAQFGWDLEHLEKENMLSIIEYTPEQLQKALEAGGGSFRDAIESLKAKRLVIDSLTEFEMLFHSEIHQRKELTDLFKALAKWDVTAMLVGQHHSLSGGHVSTVLDYEADGVIILYNERRGDIRQRSLEIYKMRGTQHAGRIFPMRITDNGIVVSTKDVALVSGKL